MNAPTQHMIRCALALPLEGATLGAMTKTQKLLKQHLHGQGVKLVATPKQDLTCNLLPIGACAVESTEAIYVAAQRGLSAHLSALRGETRGAVGTLKIRGVALRPAGHAEDRLDCVALVRDPAQALPGLLEPIITHLEGYGFDAGPFEEASIHLGEIVGGAPLDPANFTLPGAEETLGEIAIRDLALIGRALIEASSGASKKTENGATEAQATNTEHPPKKIWTLPVHGSPRRGSIHGDALDAQPDLQSLRQQISAALDRRIERYEPPTQTEQAAPLTVEEPPRRPRRGRRRGRRRK